MKPKKKPPPLTLEAANKLKGRARTEAIERWRIANAKETNPKKRGKMPAPGSAKGPTLASLTTPVVETETIERSRGAYAQPDKFQMVRQWVHCGKKRCRKAHGPYWYADRREKREGYGREGKLVRVYIGKAKDIEKAKRLLKERGLW